jgi:hypothetical protein
MFIIIHNKLINKCYFGTFGKHSVFGNGDVSNRKPNLRNCDATFTITTRRLNQRVWADDDFTYSAMAVGYEAMRTHA